jgi:hypothetical protein
MGKEKIGKRIQEEQTNIGGLNFLIKDLVCVLLYKCIIYKTKIHVVISALLL